MSVAFSTRTLRAGADRLVPGVERARALGFSAIHAAMPPIDAAAARGALATHRVALTGVSTAPIDDVSILGAAIDRAAAATAALKHRLVVVEAGPLRVPRRATAETAVGDLVRALHAALRRHAGLALALATADGPDGLVGARATEWIVSELRDEPLSFWFDTAGALRIERGDASLAAGGGAALAWADRFGSRVTGLAVHGLAGAQRHGRPEDDGLDWGTLSGLVPRKAPWVLDLAPSTATDAVEESRRYIEHVLGEGA